MAHDLWLLTLAVVFVTINGLTQLSYAYSMGFKMKPTGLAFAVASIIGFITNSVTPLSGQAAMLMVSGKIAKLSERVAALLLTSIVLVLLGIFGLITSTVQFAGMAVMFGMMAGVGLMLAEVGAVAMYQSNKRTAILSMISALILWGWTRDLVYTVAGSVAISTLDYLFIQKKRVDLKELGEQTESAKFWTKEYWSSEDWQLIKPEFNTTSILGALSLLSLSIGVTSSFGTINGNISGLPQNLDALTLTTGLANIPSILFAGAPLASIISGTSAAPTPVLGATLVMILLGVLLIIGLVVKICKYIPYESIAGFLVVIGMFSTFIPNATNAFATGDIAQAAVAMGATVITKNPFVGMLLGILVRYIGGFFGI